MDGNPIVIYQFEERLQQIPGLTCRNAGVHSWLPHEPAVCAPISVGV
jgi:hypothetical protein